MREAARFLRRLREPADCGANLTLSEGERFGRYEEYLERPLRSPQTIFLLKRSPVPLRSGPASLSLPCLVTAWEQGIESVASVQVCDRIWSTQTSTLCYLGPLELDSQDAFSWLSQIITHQIPLDGSYPDHIIHL